MILADTGIFVAATDSDDKHHLVCAELVRERAAEVIVPHTVVVEVCWLLERNFGPSVETGFLSLPSLFRWVSRADDTTSG